MAGQAADGDAQVDGQQDVAGGSGFLAVKQDADFSVHFVSSFHCLN